MALTRLLNLTLASISLSIKIETTEPKLHVAREDEFAVQAYMQHYQWWSKDNSVAEGIGDSIAVTHAFQRHLF